MAEKSMANQSIREQILVALVAAVRPAAAAMGAGVHRSPTVALSREQCPALAVFPEAEAITERTNDRVTRELTVRVVALARAVPPAAPETEADRLLTAVHAALFADSNFGGLALGLRELDSEWELEDADAVAAALPARYCITYRTLAHDLSSLG